MVTGLALTSSAPFASLEILKTLVADSNDAITLQALDGQILAWNHGAERMYGYSAAEALGMNIVAITAEADPRTLEYLRVIRDGGEAPSREVRRRTKDGHFLDVWLTTTRVHLDNAILVATTERDVTERRRQETTLRFERDAMARLHRISKLFLAEPVEERILDEILDAAIELSAAAFGNIQILDPLTGDLRIVRHRGLPAAWVDYWNHVYAGRGACGTALARRERVIVEDVARSPIFAGTEALAIQLSAGIRAVQCTPLVGRAGGPLGMLSTHYTVPTRPTQHALDMLDLLARQAADVLERVWADAALRRSEATAAGILAASADAIISIGADLRITRWNRAAEAMFGYARDEVIGRSLDVVLPERLRSAHGRRANGQEFPISATTSKIEIEGHHIVTVSVRDITEARRAEQEMSLLAELGRALASTDYDAALREIAAVSVAHFAELAVLFLGTNTELYPAATAHRDPALRPPDPHASARAAFATRRTVATHGDKASGVCVPFLTGDVCRGVLAFASTTRRFDARDVALAEEIARRCALYIENARLHQVEQQAIRARDEMLGVVAHDLRSPLSSIALQAELLRAPGRANDPAEAIARGVKRMTRIIEDLLDVARLDAGQLALERERVPVATLLANARDSLSSQVASHGLALRQDAPGALPAVFADMPRIQQVFDNLVGNAIKFTERGTITLGARDHGTEVELFVADTGVGIAPDDLVHVFDRFWQAQPARRKGAGLGLAIANGIIEAHGGRMHMESTPGQGTRVCFTLPVAR